MAHPTLEPEEHFCTKCKAFLPLSEFFASSLTHGLRTCRHHTREATRRWREGARERAHELSQRQGGGYFCNRCNETLAASRFYPSSIRNSIRMCRMHLNEGNARTAARRAKREAEQRGAAVNTVH
jgi:hypothetical protein